MIERIGTEEDALAVVLAYLKRLDADALSSNWLARSRGWDDLARSTL